MEHPRTSVRQAGPTGLYRLAGYLPGFVAGIFAGRIIGEWLGLPGWGTAAVISLAIGVLGGWLSSRRSIRETWPAFILILYIIYPEPDPNLALKVFLVAAVAFGFNWRSHRSLLPTTLKLHPLIPAVVMGLLFFIIYVRTLAPDVLAADSGELQVVAAQPGVAHPPGFPLYVMVAHLFTRLLPFVSPAFAVNMFSAVTSALTIGIVYLIVVAISRRHSAAIIAIVALGTATTFWSQATTANVRSLTGLFTALIIYALLRFRTAVVEKDRATADRWLTLTALFMGFGLAHHVSLIFLIMIGLLFIFLTDRSIAREPRRLARPVAVALIGFLPLLYLPLRATADVRGASPDLATWTGFVEHVLAIGFRGDLFYYVNPSDFIQRLRVMGNVMSFQFAAAVLAGIGVGLYFVVRKDRLLAFLLGVSFAVYLLVAATYRAPQTVEYMIPAYISASLILGCGLGFMLEETEHLRDIRLVFCVLFAAMVTVAGFSQILTNSTAAGAEHESLSAREFAEPLLRDAPADTVILAHWHWATPLWYLQEIEGFRPDVEVQFVFPEGESYDATWERRLRDALDSGRPVITTWVPNSQPTGLPVPEPVGEGLLFTQQPREVLPTDFTPSNVRLGGMIEVVGYDIELPAGQSSPGDELAITVAWRPVKPLESYGIFIHLVGRDGQIYGQDDRSVGAADGITLTQFRTTPRPGTPIGPLSIVVGLDGTQISREELGSVDITNSDEPPWTAHETSRILRGGSGMTLVGYDWDHTMADRERLYLHWKHGEEGYSTQVIDGIEPDVLMLPPYRGPWGVPIREWRFPGGRTGGHYVPLGQGIVWTGETLNGVRLAPGQPVVLDQELHSSRPINRDYVVSVRLIGLEEDGVHWDWWDLNDSIPAMGGIPTLKWIDGSFVRSPHRVEVAETAWPGQTLTGALTFYDAFTNRTLAILDERLTSQNPWIPLCQGEVIATD